MRNPYFLALFALAIVAFTVLFLKKVPHGLQSYTHLDKLAHFGIFFILSFAVNKAFTYDIYTKAISLVMYGAAIEVIQSRIANRSGSWLDLLADAVGIATFFLMLKYNIWQKITQWWAKAP
ncbi:VanZ family protein [Algibacillus agarilyticus]|uniref:VanZ family protein n=1 Tax=Algibacillus agarilyticus TaxID=2234133 RepID=UPI000DD0226A|nr:VanZ family protein [Algibacillus agarilyticus]